MQQHAKLKAEKNHTANVQVLGRFLQHSFV